MSSAAGLTVRLLVGLVVALIALSVVASAIGPLMILAFFAIKLAIAVGLFYLAWRLISGWLNGTTGSTPEAGSASSNGWTGALGSSSGGGKGGEDWLAFRNITLQPSMDRLQNPAQGPWWIIGSRVIFDLRDLPIGSTSGRAQTRGGTSSTESYATSGMPAHLSEAIRGFLSIRCIMSEVRVLLPAGLVLPGRDDSSASKTESAGLAWIVRSAFSGVQVPGGAQAVLGELRSPPGATPGSSPALTVDAAVLFSSFELRQP